KAKHSEEPHAYSINQAYREGDVSRCKKITKIGARTTLMPTQ
ncbi:11381_t:CDS:1, partial [Racocetra fulgida]